MQDVEHVVDDRDAGAARRLRVAQLHPPLQQLEARDALRIESDNLAVHHEPAQLLGGERIDQLWIGAVEQLPVARHQVQVVAVADRFGPFAVELQLEQPVVAGEARVGERGEHRRVETRPGGWQPAALEVRKLLEHAHEGGRPRERRREVDGRLVPRSSFVRPVSTDSGWVRTGLRRASAPSSRIFTNSQSRSRNRVSA